MRRRCCVFMRILKIILLGCFLTCRICCPVAHVTGEKRSARFKRTVPRETRTRTKISPRSQACRLTCVLCRNGRNACLATSNAERESVPRNRERLSHGRSCSLSIVELSRGYSLFSVQRQNSLRVLMQNHDQIAEDATGNVDDVSAASDGEQLRVLLLQGTSAD